MTPRAVVRATYSSDSKRRRTDHHPPVSQIASIVAEASAALSVDAKNERHAITTGQGSEARLDRRASSGFPGHAGQHRSDHGRRIACWR
jgi:hypothetical protein